MLSEVKAMFNKILLIYLLAVNLYGIIIMYIDKKRSIEGRWRIPEAKLFGAALLLGSPGILLGMYIFRHKTKHLKFVIGIPFILLIQLYIFYKYKII